MEHELPWKAVQIRDYWDVTTHTGDPRDEFSVLEYAGEAECRFIATACNAHAGLVAELERLLAWLDRESELVGETGTGSTQGEIIDEAVRVKSLLVNAKGGAADAA